VLSSANKFGVICYSSHRKLIHLKYPIIDLSFNLILARKYTMDNFSSVKHIGICFFYMFILANIPCALLKRLCQALWHTPIILATWEAEVGRLWSEAGPGKWAWPFLKQTKVKRLGDMAQVVEWLHGKQEVLSPAPKRKNVYSTFIACCVL
jgi:hypothetical protein